MIFAAEIFDLSDFIFFKGILYMSILRNFLHTLKTPLPKEFNAAYKDCFASAVIFLIASILLLFTFKIKLFALFSLVVSILFFITGIYRKWQLLHDGFYELHGTLIAIDRFFSTTHADGLIVDIQGRSILIPKIGNLSTPTVGTQLTVFIPAQEEPYTVNGIDCFTKIFGYSATS